MSSVEYLGHLIDQDGIRPLPSKVAATDKAPASTNVQKLHSFLGLLNYYCKFVPNFWWSGLDKAIETLAKSCQVCQTLQATPPAAPLHPWVWPETPWRRVHVDFAGPFQGKMFLS